MNKKINELENFLSGFKTQRISIAFHDLETGGEFFFRADESLHPASTFKVAVMMEVFHQAAQGTFSLGDRILVTNSFSSIADGSPFSMRVEDDAETTLYEKVGHMESLRELLRLMIVRSSNLATNILIQLVTSEKITAYLQELGIDGVTVLRGPEDHNAFARGIEQLRHRPRPDALDEMHC